MLASITNKNLEASIKPYSLNFNDLWTGMCFSVYQEFQDLNDLKNASIKELTLNSSYFV